MSLDNLSTYWFVTSCFRTAQAFMEAKKGCSRAIFYVKPDDLKDFGEVPEGKVVKVTVEYVPVSEIEMSVAFPKEHAQ